MLRTVPGFGRWVSLVAVMLAGVSILGAADFEFSTIIRAGARTGPDWELGIGPGTTNSAVTFNLNGANYYPDNTPAQFEIGYTRATNTAFLRYYRNPTTYQQVAYAGAGPGLAPGSVWTIPAGSLFVSAAARPAFTSVTIAGLSLGGGVTVLQPFSTSTLAASQTNYNSSASMGTPVVFRTGASGDWLLTGTIAFGGLSYYAGANGASGGQLSMGAGVSGTDVPEPGTSALALAGLIGVIGITHRRAQARDGVLPRRNFRKFSN